MEIRKRVGLLIRKRREAKGLSQEGLAHEAGIHRTYISSVERGVRNPTVTVLHKIALALGVTVSELVDGLKKSDG